jgi:hypothetical protein
VTDCEYVRKTYGVPACIGRRVKVEGKPGIIAEDRGNYIGVNFDSDKPGVILNAHPTWKVEYLRMGKIRKMTRSQRNYQDYIMAGWYDGDFGDWIKDRMDLYIRDREKWEGII